MIASGDHEGATSILAPVGRDLDSRDIGRLVLALGAAEGSGTHITTGQEKLSLTEVVRAVSAGPTRAPRSTVRWVSGIATVVLSLVGSLYAWSGSLVTYEELQKEITPIRDEIAPIRKRLDDTQEKLDEVATGVDSLLTRADRKDVVGAARKLVAKHRRAYEAAIDQWAVSTTSRRPLTKPQKSPALIESEVALEALLEN